MSSLPLCLLILVLRCNGLVINPYTFYNEFDRETVDEVILYDPTPVASTGGFAGIGPLFALLIFLPILSQLIMRTTMNNNNTNNNNNNNAAMGTGTAAAAGVGMGMGMGMMGMMMMMQGNRGNMGNMGNGNNGRMIGRMVGRRG